MTVITAKDHADSFAQGLSDWVGTHPNVPPSGAAPTNGTLALAHDGVQPAPTAPSQRYLLSASDH
jgi:hypothetical protein